MPTPKRKPVRRAHPRARDDVRRKPKPKSPPKAMAPAPVDNRILIVRRMRALGSTTEQIAATMGLPAATVLSIETSQGLTPMAAR